VRERKPNDTINDTINYVLT